MSGVTCLKWSPFVYYSDVFLIFISIAFEKEPPTVYRTRIRRNNSKNNLHSILLKGQIMPLFLVLYTGV